MKKVTTKVLLIAVAIASGIYSCKKGQYTPPAPSSPYNVSQTNLVADVTGLNAAQVDPNLSNAWGIAANPTILNWQSSGKK